MIEFEYVGFKFVEISRRSDAFPRYATSKREISAHAPTVILPALTELAEMGATHYITLYIGKMPGWPGDWLKVKGFRERLIAE